jgi:predicted DNA-binding transcriptional regulator YafY
MNRIDRLTGTILLLQSKRLVTAAEIAAHWEISVRTVYRDLLALSEAGVPIAGESGVGYRLMRGYHLPPIHFTADEATALFASSEVTEQIADESLKRALRSAMLKVRSVLPEERRQRIEGLDRSLKIWLRPGRSTLQADQDLLPLHAAILGRRCLRLAYRGPGGGEPSFRAVEPLGLIFYAGHWHLIAFCRLRADFRDFRTDRIVSWETLGETFTGHADFSVAQFMERAACREQLEPVTLIVEAPTAGRFRSELFLPAVREEILAGGSVRMEILAMPVPWFADWLLGFGPGVRVVHPPGLRRLVREAALRVADANAEKSPPSTRH